MKKRKGIYQNILLFIISLLVLLLILEMAFRIFLPQVAYSSARQNSPKIWQNSDYLPATLKPNAEDIHIGPYGDFNVTIKINSYGLRDYERPISMGHARILVVGDSLTFGHGVEMNETFPKQLERMLNRDGQKYQVFNAGNAGGESPGPYYLYLKNYAMGKFEPDIIILGFSYTDFSDPRRYNITMDENGLPSAIRSTFYYVDDDGRGRLTRSAIPLLKYRPVYKTYEFFLTNSHLFTFINKAATNIFLIPRRDRFFDSEYSNEMQAYWDFQKKSMLAISELAKKNKAKFIIAVIPDRRQIVDELWSQYAEILDDAQLNRTKPSDLVAEFGKENNITVINLYSIFYEKNKDSTIYLKYDGHLIPEGHKIVADEIHKQINKK